jgi:hypothetical protein
MAAAVTRLGGLPQHALRIVSVQALPRTPAGKLDAAAARLLLEADVPATGEPARDVRALFEQVLGRPASDQDTFVSLGGDSLSFVEAAVGLESLLPQVPRNWHTCTIGELAALAPAASTPRRKPRRALETSVALRAAAILAVVGSHADLFHVVGGAHLLLVLAGYNLARFQLSADRRARCAAVARSVRRIVVPTVLWVALISALGGRYGWPNALLLNHALGPQEWGATWRLWFLEALVLLMVATTALLALPRVSTLHRTRPFLLAMVLCGAGLLVRFGLLDVPTGPRGRFTAQAVLWLFALGMAAAAADGRLRQLLVLAAAALGLHGWFGDPQRELLVLGGVAVLLTVRELPSTALTTRVAGTLASASLYIYVTHWDVFPLLRDSPRLAVAASLLVGIAYWQLVGRAGGQLRRLTRGSGAAPARRRPRPPRPARPRRARGAAARARSRRRAPQGRRGLRAR